jgi:hypothetical protein
MLPFGKQQEIRPSLRPALTMEAAVPCLFLLLIDHGAFCRCTFSWESKNLTAAVPIYS